MPNLVRAEGAAQGPASDREPAGLLRHVAISSGWLLAGNIAVYGFAIVQTVILARVLGAEVFGVVSLIIVGTDLMMQLFGTRIWETATAFVAEYRAKGEAEKAGAITKVCYAADVVSATLAAGALFVFAGGIASHLVDDPHAADLVRVYAVVPLALAPVGTSKALMRLAGRYAQLAAHAAGESALRVVLIAVLAIGGTLDIGSALVAYAVAFVASSVCLVALAGRAKRDLGIGRGAPVKALAPDRRRITSFILYSSATGSLRVLTGRLDVLIIGLFVDPASAGTYRLARTVADPFVALTDPVAQSTYPQFASLVHRDRLADVRVLVSTLRRYGWFACITGAVALTLAADRLVPAVFGEAYAPAAGLTKILAWQLVWIPYLWLPGLLLAFGRARTVTVVTGIDAAVYVVLLLVCVPPFGAQGAAVATVIRFASWAVIAAIVERQVWSAEPRKVWA